MNATIDTTPASTWDDFRRRWAGPHNFLMTGACAQPLDWQFPPLDRIIAEVRADEEARFTPGTVGDRMDKRDNRERFMAMSVEKAMEQPFGLAHFKLSRFDAPGKFLHGFGERLLQRWQDALTAADFTFERCYPIIFISGRNSATNYHMDFSHVMAWQIYGTKRFCGLTDPDRWAPKDVRLNYKAGAIGKPPELTANDELCYTMRPGDALWNVLLTPHWVTSEDDAVAMSLNISHGGVRCGGLLSPNEAELEAYREAEPDKAPGKMKATY